MSRVARIALVTFALMPIGAMLGAVAGMVALGIAAQLTENIFLSLLSLGALQFAGVIGAVLGAVALPLTAWLLLRRVALGLVFGVLLAATIAGGIAGWILPLGDDDIQGGVQGAIAGYLVAAVALWIATRFSRRGVVSSNPLRSHLPQ